MAKVNIYLSDYDKTLANNYSNMSSNTSFKMNSYASFYLAHGIKPCTLKYNYNNIELSEFFNRRFAVANSFSVKDINRSANINTTKLFAAEADKTKKKPKENKRSKSTNKKKDDDPPMITIRT